MSWQKKLDNILKGNSRFIKKNGKNVIVYYITKKELDNIIKKYHVSEEIVLQQVDKIGGILIPYEIDSLPELIRLAEEQSFSKPLQDFEKKQ